MKFLSRLYFDSVWICFEGSRRCEWFIVACYDRGSTETYGTHRYKTTRDVATGSARQRLITDRASTREHMAASLATPTTWRRDRAASRPTDVPSMVQPQPPRTASHPMPLAFPPIRAANVSYAWLCLPDSYTYFCPFLFRNDCCTNAAPTPCYLYGFYDSGLRACIRVSLIDGLDFVVSFVNMKSRVSIYHLTVILLLI